MKYSFPVCGFLLLLANGCRTTTVVYPERKEIIETVYASGKIISDNEYRLAARSNGTVMEKLVKDGDLVTKGQLLYVVRNEAARERLTTAENNYRIAEANLAPNSPLLHDLNLNLQNAAVKCSQDSLTYYRLQRLWDQGIGTKNNLDNARSSYQVSQNQQKIAEQKYRSAINDMEVARNNARSQLAATRKEWNDYFIKSDRDGIVYQTFKEAGENVLMNEVVALLGDGDQRIIRLAVDQQDIARIKTGQQVLLQTDVTGHKIFEARVTRVYPVMNEADQTFRVDARFDTLPAANFIHSSVEANIIVQRKPGALVLPADVLANRDSVWVQTGNGEKKTAIQTGIVTLDYVEILSGITEKTPVLPVNKK